ncbi:MAG: hypothetical protein GY847_01840, partial [Proteobacteria bacterium]|nr:hypothetical protein [Pseudomonadota bacterium]
MTDILTGAIEKIVASFFSNGEAPLTGETVPLSIWRESDDEWFTGAAWQAGHTTFNMTEHSDGYYYYNFNMSGLSEDVYHVEAICGNEACVNPVQGGELRAGFFADGISDMQGDVTVILNDTNVIIPFGLGLIVDDTGTQIP